MDYSTDKPDPQGQTYKMIAAAMMTAPILLAVVLSFTAESGADIVWAVVAAVLVVGVAAGTLVPFLNRQVPAIPAGDYSDGARRLGMQRYQALFFRSVAICELPMLVGVVAMFVVQPVSLWHFLPGAAVTLILMALYVWPSRGNIVATQERLDRDGGRSQLAAVFGY